MNSNLAVKRRQNRVYVLCGLHAQEAGRYDAILDKEKLRYGFQPIRRMLDDILILVDIHLYDENIGIAFGYLVEDGRQISAWTAPIGKEYHQHGSAFGGHQFVE